MRLPCRCGGLVLSQARSKLYFKNLGETPISWRLVESILSGLRHPAVTPPGLRLRDDPSTPGHSRTWAKLDAPRSDSCHRR